VECTPQNVLAVRPYTENVDVRKRVGGLRITRDFACFAHRVCDSKRSTANDSGDLSRAKRAVEALMSLGSSKECLCMTPRANRRI
jgi:hypothetical protein